MFNNFVPAKKKNRYLTPSIHPTSFVSKRKNKSSWVMKDVGKNISNAIEETVAQEFFRLLCPFYPKTRWMRENKCLSWDDEYYILSKEIPKFQAGFFLSPESKETIINKKPKGLASAQVISLLLSEVDFKAGNVGIDQEGRVIKIDGGLCFSVKKDRHKDLLKKKS